MSLLIALAYAVGANIGFWALDRWLADRAERRALRERFMRNITPEVR